MSIVGAVINNLRKSLFTFKRQSHMMYIVTWDLLNDLLSEIPAFPRHSPNNKILILWFGAILTAPGSEIRVLDYYQFKIFSLLSRI